MATRAKAPSLTIDDAIEVLDKLGAARLKSLILVGGQAAAFWIVKYEIVDPRRVTTKYTSMLFFPGNASYSCARQSPLQHV